jgi:hypothetical protein
MAHGDNRQHGLEWAAISQKNWPRNEAAKKSPTDEKSNKSKF